MIDDPQEQEISDIYTQFDDFLKEAISEYYKKGGKGKRANFISLIIASGEIASMAMDQLKTGAGFKKIALGAAGMLALRIGLKYALGGPLGIILAGATAASLIAYFVRNRGEIANTIVRHRKLVLDVRKSYEKLQSNHRDGRLDDEQRELMVDGLMKRFLDDVDNPRWKAAEESSSAEGN